ncbi:MAG: dihydrolipoamide acetyltransferase family protein [Bacteroidales bacterium]
MAQTVLMPRQGQSVETCIITKWFKEKGDKVEEGEILFSYETDKAAFDEMAAISGTLLDVFYQEGDEVPVLKTVAVIGEPGEDTSVSEKEETVEKSTAENVSPTKEIGKNKPSQGKRQVLAEDEGKKIRISPRARRMATDMSINIGNLTGSGPNGRIVAADITAAANKEVSADSVATPQKSASPALSYGEFTDQPLSNMRKIIATNMMHSLSQSAQLTHHTSADARKILALRMKIKEGTETRLPATTTLNDMVSYAIIQALTNFPGINAHFLDDKIRSFTGVHLGMAVDTPRGLMVPVLKNADRFTLAGLGLSLSDLAESCLNNTVDPDLLAPEAGSFTVSNLGIYGVEMFTPVLNLPQCGIMGINTISMRPAELHDGITGFVPHIGLSLTYDHRAIDGAPASRFLQEVSKNIAHFNPNI